MSGLAVSMTFEISGEDPEFAQRHAERMADVRPFLEQAGVYMLSSMLGRLEERLNKGDDVVRTGMLTASLAPTTRGAEGQVFSLEDAAVEVGSNLAYAAQVDQGGLIVPVSGGALAIPLTMQLKRSGKWPRDFGPDELVFVKTKHMPPRTAGFLFEKTLTGKTKKRPSFVLKVSVYQEGKHFAVIDDEDREAIDELWERHLEKR